MFRPCMCGAGPCHHSRPAPIVFSEAPMPPVTTTLGRKGQSPGGSSETQKNTRSFLPRVTRLPGRDGQWWRPFVPDSSAWPFNLNLDFCAETVDHGRQLKRPVGTAPTSSETRRPIGLSMMLRSAVRRCRNAQPLHRRSKQGRATQGRVSKLPGSSISRSELLSGRDACVVSGADECPRGSAVTSARHL